MISPGPSLELDARRVRILVVGDAGVGKSSLVTRVCGLPPRDNIPSTIGCAFQISSSSIRGQRWFIEFFDLAGSSRYAESRSVFYSGNKAHGIMFVYDLENRRSFRNIRKWIEELTPDYGDNAGGFAVPALCVGCKVDSICAKDQRVFSECNAQRFYGFEGSFVVRFPERRLI